MAGNIRRVYLLLGGSLLVRNATRFILIPVLRLELSSAWIRSFAAADAVANFFRQRSTFAPLIRATFFRIRLGHANPVITFHRGEDVGDGHGLELAVADD